jgi:uncharacterized membrane protein YfcA
MKGGSSPNDSILGIVKCEHVDWILFGVLQFICAVYLVLGLRVLKKEYKEKTDAEYPFIPGDLQATTYNLNVMVVVSFLGSVYAAFSGIGPGMVFCPALIMIGIES